MTSYDVDHHPEYDKYYKLELSSLNEHVPLGYVLNSSKKYKQLWPDLDMFNDDHTVKPQSWSDTYQCYRNIVEFHKSCLLSTAEIVFLTISPSPEYMYIKHGFMLPIQQLHYTLSVLKDLKLTWLMISMESGHKKLTHRTYFHFHVVLLSPSYLRIKKLRDSYTQLHKINNDAYQNAIMQSETDYSRIDQAFQYWAGFQTAGTFIKKPDHQFTLFTLPEVKKKNKH